VSSRQRPEGGKLSSLWPDSGLQSESHRNHVPPSRIVNRVSGLGSDSENSFSGIGGEMSSIFRTSDGFKLKSHEGAGFIAVASASGLDILELTEPV